MCPENLLWSKGVWMSSGNIWMGIPEVEVDWGAEEVAIAFGSPLVQDHSSRCSPFFGMLPTAWYTLGMAAITRSRRFLDEGELRAFTDSASGYLNITTSWYSWIYALFPARIKSSWVASRIICESYCDTVLGYIISFEFSIKFSQRDALNENDGSLSSTMSGVLSVTEVEQPLSRQYGLIRATCDEVSSSWDGVGELFCEPEDMVVECKAITRPTINGAHHII